MKKLLFILLFSPMLCFGQATTSKQDSVSTTQTEILNQEMLIKNLEAKPTLELSKQVSMLQNEVQFLQNQQRQIMLSMHKTQKDYYIGIGMTITGFFMSLVAISQNPNDPGPVLQIGNAVGIGGGLISFLSFRHLSKSNTSIRYNTLK